MGVAVSTAVEEPVRPQKAQVGKELANLDCLRSFAVLSVIIDHAGVLLASVRGAEPAAWVLKIGHIGVLAFFVHTSLVLMFSLERLSRSPNLLTLRFYIRRVFRIYPLSILCVGMVLLLKIPVFPFVGAAFQPPTHLVSAANFLLVQNFLGRKSVTAPLWSLPFEVQMYLALPVCFFLASKRRGLFYLGLCLLSFAGIGSAVKHFTGHWNLLEYIPCFLAGVLAYTLRHRIRPLLGSTVWPSFLCLWIVASLALMVKWPALEMQIGWLSCICLGLSIYCFRDCHNAWWNSATKAIAQYSYGIYLGHVPMLWLVFRVWGITNPLRGTCTWLAMTAVLAVLSYHLVEEPMIGVGRRLSR